MSIFNVKALTDDQLCALQASIQVELNDRDPHIIAQRKQMQDYWTERERKGKLQELYINHLLRGLKPILKPGMRLKMTGCKDGKGIREFIKFDENDNLVCWQIKVGRRAGGFGYVDFEENTYQVTTHMPDKVSWVLVDGKKVAAKGIAASA